MSTMTRTWSLLVHAGAGEHSRASDRVEAYCNAMREACDAGRAALLATDGCAMAACVAAVACMEDDSSCNAGLGSNLTEDGTVECDASVMDGAECSSGACGAVAGIRNPVRLARALLEAQASGELTLGRVHPMLLVGEGARKWAQAHPHVGLVEPISLVTPRARTQWNQYMVWLREAEAEAELKFEAKAKVATTSSPGGGKRKRDSPDARLAESLHDTVGAVCCDGTHVAAAVSSGGIWLKHSGRVGEAAVFGAGCWACDASGHGDDASVAASVSGVGEQVMRRLLARASCEALRRGPDVLSGRLVSLEALSSVLLDTPHADGRANGSSAISAGVIAVRCVPSAAEDAIPTHELLVAHTTPSFAVGFVSSAFDVGRRPSTYISRRPEGSLSRPTVLLVGASLSETFIHFPDVNSSEGTECL